jgi:RNA polymerase sigma-70 factor (ECF subfamily)
MYPDEMVLSDNQQASAQPAALDKVETEDAFCFEQVFERYNSMVFNLAFQVLGNWEEALDLSQEVFFTIARKMHSFRGESSLKTWIYSIALHRATNRLRWRNRLRRRGSVSLEEYLARKPDEDYCISLKSGIRSPEEALIIKEERGRLNQLLQRVPLQKRIAVILRDIEGLTYEEIAESMKVSLGTVKSRIARGRDILRRLVAET